MPRIPRLPLPSALGRRTAPLYLAPFFLAMSESGWLLAIPLVFVKHFGTGNSEAGLCVGLHLAAYTAGCILTAPITHLFNNKRLVQFAIAGMTTMIAAVLTLIALHTAGLWQFKPVFCITVLMTFAGLFMALFWPCLMGWLSTDREGPRLSRRLGRFNVSWSLASIIGPFLAASLLNISPVWPFATATILLIIAFIAITLAPKPPSHAHTQAARKTPAPLDPRLPCFRWMARIALFTGCLAVGTIRPHLPLLLNIDLHFPEAICGLVLAIMSFAGFSMYLATGRYPAWPI